MDHKLTATLGGFQSEYGSEKEWETYFYQIKWPSGFSCPQCSHRQYYTIQARKRPLYQCRSCGHQTSLTAGTILEGSRTSLLKWAYAIHLVAGSSHGVNAVQLQSFIGVTYKTAWSMLNKIRMAISSQDKEQPLTGIIQAGLAFCGNFQPVTGALTKQEHPVIFAAVEDESDQSAWIKIKMVSRSHIRGKMLVPMRGKAFIREHVECMEDTSNITIADSRLRSRRLPQLVETMGKFRAWSNRMFHGLGSRRLQGYLDEFCFRYNHHSRPRLNVQDQLSRICMSFRAV